MNLRNEGNLETGATSRKGKVRVKRALGGWEGRLRVRESRFDGSAESVLGNWTHVGAGQTTRAVVGRVCGAATTGSPSRFSVTRPRHGACGKASAARRRNPPTRIDPSRATAARVAEAGRDPPPPCSLLITHYHYGQAPAPPPHVGSATPSTARDTAALDSPPTEPSRGHDVRTRGENSPRTTPTANHANRETVRVSR